MVGKLAVFVALLSPHRSVSIGKARLAASELDFPEKLSRKPRQQLLRPSKSMFRYS